MYNFPNRSLFLFTFHFKSIDRILKIEDYTSFFLNNKINQKKGRKIFVPKKLLWCNPCIKMEGS